MSHGFSPDTLDDDPLVPRRAMHDEAKFDITAMIDLVFMMNIFFLVTTVGAALAEIDLPPARHCAPADLDTSVVFSLVAAGDNDPALVYIGDGPSGKPIAVDDQERVVRDAVEAGVRANKTTILIKAEKRVRLRDVARVAAAATAVSGTELKMAVIEME